MARQKLLFTLLGPLAAILVYFWLESSLGEPMALTASITLWTAIWWIFEPIPIPATSLMPLALFPTFGIHLIHCHGTQWGASQGCAHHGELVWG